MYTVPQSEQLNIFIVALGFGFLLGILYDLLRALRIAFTKSHGAIIAFDIIYFLLFGFLTILFIIALNKGEVRFYIIAGQVIGWLFYYFTFGIAVIKFTDFFISLLKRIFSFIYKVLTAPFRLILKVLNSIYGKIRKLFKKSRKKSENLGKKHLPKLRLYVYNLFRIVSVDNQKKGGKRFGKKEKEAS